MTEHERRPLPKFNAKLAEQYGITPGADDHPREFVSVSIDAIPNPPGVEAAGTARPAQSGLNLEETVIHVLAEEMDELATRLAKFNVALNASAKQQLIDTALALLSGTINAGSAHGGRR